MNNTVPILAYHKVDEEAPTKYWVSTASFDAQMAALREHEFEAVSLEDLWLSAQSRKELPKKPVCITFDDGYANFYSKAFPILQKYGFVATVFLPTAFIGDSHRHSNDWDRSPEERSYRTAHLLWDEVLQLQRYGVEFEAHTKTHQDLASLFQDAPLQATAEVVDSKKEIESRLSVKVGFLSYPYKSSNSDIEIIARQAGFRGAVTVNERVFDISRGNWFEMDRLPVYSSGTERPADNSRADFLSLIGETQL